MVVIVLLLAVAALMTVTFVSGLKISGPKH